MSRKKESKAAAEAKPFGSAGPVIGDRAALDAEVERRKRLRGDGSEVEPHLQRAKREPEPLNDVLERIMSKHGLTMVDVEAANETLERDGRIRLAEVERERLERGWRWRCPARYREEFFLDLLPENVDKANVRRVLAWRPSERGLYIIGDSGRGKTRAVFTMLKRAYLDGKTVEWYDGVGFAVECSRVFADSALTERWLRSMIRPDVVFIDDLAKRFTPATQQGFFAVLDRRTAARKPIVLTSNCSGDMLATMIGDDQIAEPMRRRLKQFCEVIRF